MHWTDILLTSTITTALTSALGFLLKEWIATRLKESISADYKKEFELFKQQITWEEKRKQQAAQVADLLSFFLAASYDKNIDRNLHRHELQKKYWELALWLDAPILRAINDALNHPSAPIPHIYKALLAVRQLLVAKDDTISPEELFRWDPKPWTEKDHQSLNKLVKQ